MTNIKEAKEFSTVCIGCIKKPCQTGCPLSNDTTGFIKLTKEGKYQEAYKLLTNTTIFASLCGRICPHEKQCQGKCVKRFSHNEVQIGAIEAFLGDMALENNWYVEKINIPLKKEKIAIIGGGPAGLTCAYFLRKNGYNVTIYEKHNYLGGLLNHGIPDFRLPKDLLKKVVDNIISTGIEVKLNQELGKDVLLQDLEKNYDVIFLGFGANISNKMNIAGENLNGVYGGNELLENNEHPDYTGKTVVVSGGGNVAMDVSRTIKKLGAEKVYVIYRRSEKESPAEFKEIEEAKEEGIEFLFLTNILRIIGKDKVEKIECIRTELKQQEEDSRLSPVNIEGSNYFIECDYVMMAVGSKPEESIVNTLDVDLDEYNMIKIDEQGRTSKKHIFAGGDIAGARKTVAWAARSGRNAADSIINYLETKR